MSAPHRRKNKCWISAYEQLTADLPSPLVFRRWAAIAGISMSLERRCWIGAGASRIYPNLYILLVANPGVGKDMAIGPLRDLLHEAKKIHIAQPA